MTHKQRLNSRKFKAYPLAMNAYQSPPVVEAVFEFRFQSDVSIEKIDAFVDVEFRGDRYKTNRLKHVEAKINVDTDRSETGTVSLGTRILDQVEPRVIRLQRNAFAYSWLVPYVTWDEWSIEASALWRRYVALVNPSELHRIGIRYINKIKIPISPIRVEDYLTVYPTWPDSIAERVKTSNMVVNVDLPETSSTAVLRVLAHGYDDGIECVLDVDIARTTALPTDPEATLGILSEMKRIEREMFELSITNMSRALFK